MYGVPDFYQNDNVKKGTGMQWRHQVVSDLPILAAGEGKPRTGSEGRSHLIWKVGKVQWLF